MLDVGALASVIVFGCNPTVSVTRLRMGLVGSLAAALVAACSSGAAGAPWYTTAQIAVKRTCNAYRVRSLAPPSRGGVQVVVDWQSKPQAQSQSQRAHGNTALLERSPSGFRVKQCISGHYVAGLR